MVTCVILSDNVFAQFAVNPSTPNRANISPNPQYNNNSNNNTSYAVTPFAASVPVAPVPANPANNNPTYSPQPAYVHGNSNNIAPNNISPNVTSNTSPVSASHYNLNGSNPAPRSAPVPVTNPYSTLAVSATSPMSAEQAHAIITQKLYTARCLVASRDFIQAERIANEVRGLNLQYQPTDDRPEAIIGLIRQQNSLDEFYKANGSTEQFRRNYAIFLLSQANYLLNYGDIELATKLNNVAIAQSVLYNESDNKNGLTPQAVDRRIADIKNYRVAVAAQNNPAANKYPTPTNQPLSITTQRQLTDAIAIMRSAREAVDSGNLERARNLCASIQNMQLPDSLFPPNSDTPTKLLGEIAVRSQSVRQPAVYPTTSLNAASNHNVNHNMAGNVANVPVANVANIINTPASYPQDNQNGLSNAVYNENSDTTHTRHATSLPDTSDFVNHARRTKELAMQQLSMEVIRMISDAKRLTNENRHNEAVELLNKARTRIDDAQIDDATKAAFYKNIEDSLQTTNKHVEQNRSRIELDDRNQEVWNKLRNESEVTRSREEQIKTYVEEVSRLNSEQEYDQAILIAKKARDFAPNELVTQLLLQHTQMLANVRRSEINIAAKQETVLRTLHGVDETAIVESSIFDRDIAYSSNWGTIRQRKSASDLLYDRPESEKQIIRKLETPISFSTDRPIAFREFIDLLRAQTGLNIDVDWRELQEAYVTSDTPVSLRLSSEIKLKNVLNQILGQWGLAYVVKNEMLNITSANKTRGQLATKTYYVGDLIMPIRDFDGSSPHDMWNSIERSMNQYRPNNPQNYRDLQNNKWNPAIPFPVNNVPVSYQNNNSYAANQRHLSPSMINAQINTGLSSGNGGSVTGNNFTGSPSDVGFQDGSAGGSGANYQMIIDLIQAATSWKDSEEGSSITEFDPSLSIVVKQTEQVHAEIADLLAQLRKLSDLQIAVEVRYITISDDYYEKMGVDFQAKIRNDGASDKIVTYASSGSDSSTDSDSSSSSSATGIAKGNNVTVGLQGPSQFQFDLSIPISQNTYGLADPMYGGFNPDSGLRMGFALLSDIEAYFFINATQGDSRSNVLQAPKVMIFNGQMGSVVDSTQSPFVTSVVPVVGDFAIGYQPIIAVLNDGQVMNVRGTVSPNRQYVRLTLEPRFNTITKVSTFRYVGDENATDTTTSSGNSEASDGTASADERRGTTKTTARSASGVTIQQPIMASFSVQTTVSVPDGGTILMGGIKRLREGRIEAGTPILDKIPFLNRLFMNTAIGRDTSSILMVVTPRIIIQEEEEEQLTGIRP
jgi:general secretion pathway protein D